MDELAHIQTCVQHEPEADNETVMVDEATKRGTILPGTRASTIALSTSPSETYQPKSFSLFMKLLIEL